MARDISLTVSLPDRPVLIRADPVLVEQALVNLIDNARLHGGPNLSTVTVTLWEDRGYALVDVRDDGVGMTLEDTTLAVERFGQLKPSEGSGLGLSIAEAVAEGAQGRLRLIPLDPGLSVQIAFPLAQSPKVPV